MPSSIRGSSEIFMNHSSFDANSTAGSAQSTYTVHKAPMEMGKSNISVLDILKVNLMNSKCRRKVNYRQSFDESINPMNTLNQRSRMEVISKSLGTLKGLSRCQIRASIDSTNLSMDHTIREINNDSTISKLKYNGSVKNGFMPNRSQHVKSTTPSQQISSSTLNENPLHTNSQNTMKKMLEDIESIFQDHKKNDTKKESQSNNSDHFNTNLPKNVPVVNRLPSVTDVQQHESKTATSTMTSSANPRLETAQNGDLDLTTSAATLSDDNKHHQSVPNNSDSKHRSKSEKNHQVSVT